MPAGCAAAVACSDNVIESRATPPAMLPAQCSIHSLHLLIPGPEHPPMPLCLSGFAPPLAPQFQRSPPSRASTRPLPKRPAAHSQLGYSPMSSKVVVAIFWPLALKSPPPAPGPVRGGPILLQSPGARSEDADRQSPNRAADNGSRVCHPLAPTVHRILYHRGRWPIQIEAVVSSRALFNTPRGRLANFPRVADTRWLK